MSDGDVQQIRTSPYMSPMQQYGSSIILMTNPESELQKMELTLRSMRLDSEGNPVAAGEPLMNDKGVSSILGTVQSIVNQVTIMSNLDNDEIESLMMFLADTLVRDLMVNRVTYKIKSFAAREKIFFTCMSSAFITMKRAFEEGDKRFWKGSVQEIRSTTESEPRKGGIFSNIWRSK